jgi:uncharacterized protein (DUF2252 family)
MGSSGNTGSPAATLEIPGVSSSWEAVEGYVSTVDLRDQKEGWETRRAEGKALRKRTPREDHAIWIAPPDRPDPVTTVIASNRGRQPEFVPLRMSRMAESPFAFLRGAAAVMAWDLARTPVSGINVVIDGDAHLSNFGFYGTAQRSVVFDLNDFDETTFGPWEFDLKRLLVSVNVVARQNGANHKACRQAVLRCASAYRENTIRFQSMGYLDLWHLHAYPGLRHPLVHPSDKAVAATRRALERAVLQTNQHLLERMAQRRADGTWEFRDDPPVLKRLDRATADKVIEGLNAYVNTIAPERRALLRCYRVADVAHRVVGVGSVGTRAYLALLFGNGDDDPLFLQVKEATAPALAPYVSPLPASLTHDGRRVVLGQRTLQASSDILIGWTTIDGRPFYVRQMRNLKGSMDEAKLAGDLLDSYAAACGLLLGRAHSRWGAAAAIAGYCGNSTTLDEALADFAEAYGEQNDRDYAAFAKAYHAGAIPLPTE